MKSFLYRSAAALLLASALVCSADATGNPIYDFLRIPMNARAASLGNTFLTVRNDPAGTFYNPGLLSTLERPSASAGFLKYLLDVNAGYASYGQAVEGIGWIGGGVVYVNYGSFDETDRQSNVIGSFGASDLALSATVASVYENLHYGATVKFIHSSIADVSSSGLALDAGVAYAIPSEGMVLGLSVLNLGTQVSTYAGKSERLPLDVKIGVSKKLEHLPLTVLLNFHKLNESSDSFFDRFSAFSFGGEFTLSKYLRARIGYNNEMRRELKIGDSAKLAGFSAGLGLTASAYLVDYAYTSFGLIGSAHRFSIGTSF